MLARLIPKLGSHYILVMMIVTRLISVVGGTLTIYYIDLTLRVTPQVKLHFELLAAFTVTLAMTATVLLALWETRACGACWTICGGAASCRFQRRWMPGARRSSSPAGTISARRFWCRWL